MWGGGSTERKETPKFRGTRYIWKEQNQNTKQRKKHPTDQPGEPQWKKKKVTKNRSAILSKLRKKNQTSIGKGKGWGDRNLGKKKHHTKTLKDK